MQSSPDKARVVILGGGVAGVEGALALHDLAADRVELTMVSPGPDFVYKPLTVEEPFSGQPAERYELAPFIAELGGRFVGAGATRVRPQDHLIELDDATELGYDALLVCLGARAMPPYDGGTTLSTTEPLPVDELIEGAAGHPSRTLAIVTRAGAAWPLPAYELALMTARRARELDAYGLRVLLVTPEESPLGIFGPLVSASVAELLRARDIETRCGTRVEQLTSGEFMCHPGRQLLEVGELITMPLLLGPSLPDLPADRNGFIPIDGHAKVVGVDDVWAAGDGTNFPVKQGGLATQQADAAAESIAASLGAALDPKPFEPVLRGQLLTGGDSLHMKSDLAGRSGDGRVSADCLWWPPNKVVGRYLPSFLSHEAPASEPPAPREAVDVEVALDHDWHSEPMALDPVSVQGGGVSGEPIGGK